MIPVPYSRLQFQINDPTPIPQLINQENIDAYFGLLSIDSTIVGKYTSSDPATGG